MRKRIFVTGAAGLVGQNLLAALQDADVEIVGVDKHHANLQVLRRLQPGVRLIEADLAEAGAEWMEAAAACDAVVMLQAQIGGLDRAEFVRNNVTATQRVLEAATAVGRSPYLVHVSSSVVNSAADDFYTQTKAEQEAMVAACGLKQVILRPTLMFGWFDRKHVGWLRRFMDRAPVFPIPGSGRYLRQPLFAGDFCRIIAACLERETTGAYNISGLEKVDYIDLIRLIRKVTASRTPVVRIPYGLFWALLATYAVFDRNPPFTTRQLEALVTPDVFEVIDWPQIFGTPATPLEAALAKTFLDPVYSDVTLEF